MNDLADANLWVYVLVNLTLPAVELLLQLFLVRRVVVVDFVHDRKHALFTVRPSGYKKGLRS